MFIKFGKIIYIVILKEFVIISICKFWREYDISIAYIWQMYINKTMGFF